VDFSPPIQNIEKMKSFHLITCCISLIVAGCGCGKKSGNTQDWTFHTTPDKWEEPRIFHTPFDKQWANRIGIERIPTIEVGSEKTISPNKAYWFYVQEPDTSKPAPYELIVDIYNERDYLLRLKISDVYGNFIADAKWINEKLIYAEAWWGRVLGVNLLFDVESEQIIYKENVHDGGIDYSQWQQAKTENKNCRVGRAPPSILSFRTCCGIQKTLEYKK
jgi:hypothetical protein